ncbi:Armadillo-type fold [Micractinium conductrix]|uniref:Exportin-4 n=1 Tax=Micractinium conductrix TaxID=554055 RepID=A0A2P6VP40_9CHLO|nr:Armadillo-type fold [Micractinium conductrix]|eukprot:PSC75864.1 Armadillo-type fold [Micractinium conductrix]
MDPAVVAGFAEACAGLHHPATRVQAEAALLEFRLNASVEACVGVLQASGDEGVRFQALLALREVVLGRWAVVGAQARQATLQFLLHTSLVQLAADPRPLLRTQVNATAAAIIKRSWVEANPAEQEQQLSAIHTQAAAVGTAAARRAGLELLTAVVEEFSPHTASQLGLSWEVHELCRESLESCYLHRLLLHALGSAREAAPAAASGADAAGVCLAALRLLSAVLGWSFSRAGGSGVWRMLDSGRPAAEAASLRPPDSWREALLAPDSWGWLAQLAHAVCQPQAAETPLMSAALRVVEQLCGLRGDIFWGCDTTGSRAALGLPSQPSQRGSHLAAMLRLLLPWLSPPAAAVAAARWSAAHAGQAGGEARLLSACRALLAAAGVHRAAGFDAASPALGLTAAGAAGTLGVLGVLSELTTAVLAAAADPPGEADDWAGEAADLLLEMWVELVYDSCRGPMGSSQAAVQAAAAVFAAVTDKGLTLAAAEALEDDEEVEGGEGLQAEEQLARVAALGRASARLSLPLLAERLQGCLGALQQALQQGADPSVPLEQLCWLAALCAAVLADAGDGETPLVPLPVAQAGEAAAAGGAGAGADPAQRLSAGLLALGGHCLVQAGQVGASPRLVEVAAASLARWADTYLATEEEGMPALRAAFGAGSQGGGQAAQMLVSLVMSALTRYPGERALHDIACARLLPALLRRPAARQAVVDSPAWHTLCDAVGRGDAGLLQLAEKVQRRLLQSLLLAAGDGWQGDAGSWAGHLLESTAVQLRQAGASDAAARAALQRADGLHLVVSLIERLRGAVRGTQPATQAALFQQFTSVAPALATLFDACRTQPVAVTLILKLAGEVVEHHSSYLSPADAQALCSWSLRLLQLYSAHNLGQVSAATEALGDRYLDLHALIKLLTKLTQGDWDAGTWRHTNGAHGAPPAGGAPQAAAVDVAALVFTGLDILVPLLSLELLKFPKLCRAYFALLAHMLEAYPERMAQLPPRVFQTLLSTLQFGVGATGDEEVTQAVFEAAAALAWFHVQETAAGGPGLGSNNAAGADGLTPLGTLLQASLQRLIHGEAGLEAVDHAAEAVLPMALADPPALQRAGEALVVAAAGVAKSSAQEAFTALVAQHLQS